MRKGWIPVLSYIAIILAPLAISIAYVPDMHKSFLYELGRAFALTGIMIIIMQVALASRIKWIEKYFGFDMVLRFHRHIVVFGAALVIAHPILLAIGVGGWDLITSMKLPWYILLGKGAMLLLVLNVATASWQRGLKMKYEAWRILHDVMAVLLIAAVFIHSSFAGRDITHSSVLTVLWIILPCAALVLFFYHRFLRPYILGKKPYRVDEVIQETKDIWTVKMSPPEGAEIPAYAPGQFQFITFHRDKKLPVEEHHWTISSDPADKKHICSTIKDLGDFTSTIKDTRPGDNADIYMPFGKFSYIYFKPVNGFVFIAGGIGITPFISMLRHLNSAGSAEKVLLIYADRNEEDIAFRTELERIERTGKPALSVVHVLSGPGKNWSGETGHIDGERILRLCGNDISGKMFLASGPKEMVRSAVSGLKQAGVADENIDIEVFSLLD